MSFKEDGFTTAKELEEEQTTITAKAEVVEEVGTTDIAVGDNSLPDYAILNPELPMRVKIGVAGEVASCLKDVIEQQNLIVKGLGGNKNSEYVTIEGWEVLGTMLGITPVTYVTEEIKNKQDRTVGYKSVACLYRNATISDGDIISGELIARAEASADKSGFQKDLPSIMSMSQTRALGKCYRMALSWIVKMAGYEGTFAEDMPDYRG